ncbi:hypothetical protein KVR01_006653 [Diaporthe batatas]|uniref:uncharacterized protein n=1 Tax=Diaporthe batatas TaxID=748121 RepID=UPI001D036AFE|nr:uncharacterized protein KVR01_006653 [Diaporthe batatas]KAG8163356.1 hypothetical protein KVR01_006653 [Diaporthe batatas]
MSTSTISPERAPELDLPVSSNTVRVRAIDTTTRMVCSSAAFVQPVLKGHETLNFRTLAFLVEHEGPSGTQRVLFDAGSRKDFWNGSPKTQEMIKACAPGMEVEYNVEEILVASGLELTKLKAVIWSHWHWDHIGDGSKFPGSTDIVVGPGFVENFAPGWPTRPESCVLASDLEGHRIHEPEFPLNIGGFRGHDYFADGSFYLLDVPGHAVGHICGFARTTPDTFIFMGADCCHFAGMIRPSLYNPLPSIIPPEQVDALRPKPCPCSVFTAHHPAASQGDVKTRTQPFYNISTAPGSAYSFAAAAQKTAELVLLFDANPHVFVCLAHDGALFDVLPLYNSDPTSDINDWKDKDYDERAKWGFLNELPYTDYSPGRGHLVPLREDT